MIHLFNRYWLLPAVVTLLVETSLVLASFAISHRLRSLVYFGTAKPDSMIYTPTEFWLRAGAFAGTILIMLYINGLYDFDKRLATREVGMKVLQSVTLAAVTLWGLYFIVPAVAPGRAVFGVAFTLALLSLGLWRLLLSWLVDGRLFAERILIVGADEAAKELAREVLTRRHLGYRVVGFLADDPELQGMRLVNPRVIGTTSQACDLALANRVTRIVVAQHDSRGKVCLDSLLKCKARGIPVSTSSTYYEELTGKVMLDGPRIKSWLVFSSGFLVSRSASIVKRFSDLVVGSIGLVAAAPLMFLIALVIKLDSRGPVLYRQERLGQHGKTFELWKFRSMRPDAEAGGVAQWAKLDDPRITRVGKLLRKARLDELPQLWNIVRGDMSLVGPRPERKPFVDELIERYPLYEERLSVRPGLTGWAQIRAPYASSFEDSVEKLRYDLYYIKNISFFLDLSILASTLRIVLFGRGAR